jgi:uncharacterized membrane protein YhiD involved in acid resistance
MGVELVERHGLEFWPRAKVDGARLRRRLSDADWARRARAISSAGWLIGAGAMLAAATYYVADRGLALPTTAPPTVRLGVAAAIGVLLTAVHTHVKGGRTLGYSLARAQTLLCVAGALTMILIDNSVARAFGIAGAASIVRFRTPVDDPTDATVLFLSMALGMACGVGAFGLAIAGTAGVCFLLAGYGTIAPEPKRRNITIELVASGHDFPDRHVQAVFARHNVTIDPSEWSQDKATRVKYRASVDEALSLEALGAQLMDKGEAGLQSVAWDVRKNSN